MNDNIRSESAESDSIAPSESGELPGYPELPRAEPAGGRFARRVGLFTLGTIISRLLGLVREQVFAFLFGAGMATDAYNIAFDIPNFLRDMLAENAFSAAFVPELVDGLAHRKREEVWRFASNVLNVMMLLVVAIVVLLMIFTPQVTRVIARGFIHDPAKLALTASLTRIMMPFLLFVALGAWSMGMLNSLGSFFVPGVAPGVFNVISILTPLASFAWFRAHGMEPITGMAWGVTIGALFQFLVQLPQLFRHGFRYRFHVDFGDPEVRKVLFVRLPFRALGLATWQVNYLVTTILITFLAERSVTYLNNAYRIMHLPAGLFGVAIGSVALVELSADASGGNLEAVKEHMRHGLRLVTVIMLPIAAIMIGLAVPIVRVIYQHGRFTPENTLATATALMLYTLGVWAPGASRTVAAGFFAVKNTKTPAITGFFAVGLCIGMNLLLMHRIGYLSFALNTALAQMVDFGLLYYLFRRKMGGLGTRRIFGLMLKVALISVICGLAAFGLLKGMNAWYGHPTQELHITMNLSGVAADSTRVTQKPDTAMWLGMTVTEKNDQAPMTNDQRMTKSQTPTDDQTGTNAPESGRLAVGGLRVARVELRSRAHDALVQTGDIVVSVNQNAVQDIPSLSAALSAAVSAGQPVVFGVRRERYPTLFALAEIIIGGIIALLLYYGLARLFRIEEVPATLNEFWLTLRRRMKPTGK